MCRKVGAKTVIGCEIKKKTQLAVKRSKKIGLSLTTCLITVMFAVFSLAPKIIEKINYRSLQTTRDSFEGNSRFWGVCIWEWNANGNLRTMNRVFQRLGYEFVNGTNDEEWDVLWSLEYPFCGRWPEIFKPVRQPLKFHQRINHFPGINFITSKVYMNSVNQEHPYILQSFRFPEKINEFKAYAAANPTKKIVEKDHQNRGVRIVNMTDVNYDTENLFYQEFMDRPFLIDGRVFDLGIFVLITSVDPLRIYRYTNEILLRFCPEPYHPFDEHDTRKYVISDDHSHFFEIPSLNHYFDKYGFSFKNALLDYLSNRGHNVEDLQRRIDDAIVQVIQRSEMNIVEEVCKFCST